MDYQLNTRLNGNIAMTSSYHERASLQRDKTLYKFSYISKVHTVIFCKPMIYIPTCFY